MLKPGTTYTLKTRAPSVLGAEYEGEVTDIGTYNSTWVRAAGVDSTQTRVLLSLPATVAKNHKLYTYYRIKLVTGKSVVLAEEWLSSSVMLDSRTAVIRIQGAEPSVMNTLSRYMSAQGLNYTVEYE